MDIDPPATAGDCSPPGSFLCCDRTCRFYIRPTPALPEYCAVSAAHRERTCCWGTAPTAAGTHLRREWPAGGRGRPSPSACSGCRRLFPETRPLPPSLDRTG